MTLQYQIREAEENDWSEFLSVHPQVVQPRKLGRVMCLSSDGRVVRREGFVGYVRETENKDVPQPNHAPTYSGRVFDQAYITDECPFKYSFTLGDKAVVTGGVVLRDTTVCDLAVVEGCGEIRTSRLSGRSRVVMRNPRSMLIECTVRGSFCAECANLWGCHIGDYVVVTSHNAEALVRGKRWSTAGIYQAFRMPFDLKRRLDKIARETGVNKHEDYLLVGRLQSLQSTACTPPWTVEPSLRFSPRRHFSVAADLDWPTFTDASSYATCKLALETFIYEIYGIHHTCSDISPQYGISQGSSAVNPSLGADYRTVNAAMGEDSWLFP